MKSRISRSMEILKEQGFSVFLEKVSQYMNWNRFTLFVELFFRNPLAWVGTVTEFFTGFDVYLWLLEKAHGDFVVWRINGCLMKLGVCEEGISRDLIRYGEREAEATKKFKELLIDLRHEKDCVTVLEIGGNIGYYALLEARVLEDKANIICFEPSPPNIERLEENVELNGFGGRVDVVPLAAGAEERVVEFEVSTHSNLSRVKGVLDNTNDVDKVVSADVVRVDDYLDVKNVSPESVDVVRMDVEGFEYQVLKGLTNVIEASNPSVFFIEFHSIVLSPVERNQIVGWFRGNGFELVHSSRNYLDLGLSFQDLRVMGKGSPELIFVKKSAEELVDERLAQLGESR